MSCDTSVEGEERASQKVHPNVWSFSPSLAIFSYRIRKRRERKKNAGTTSRKGGGKSGRRKRRRRREMKRVWEILTIAKRVALGAVVRTGKRGRVVSEFHSRRIPPGECRSKDRAAK